MTHPLTPSSSTRWPGCATASAWLVLAASLAACGGGGGDVPPAPSPWDRFSIGGTVSGLAEGSRLVLQNNGGDDLAIAANGRFGFATPIAVGHPYAVRVQSQPEGQTCRVTHGSGAVPGAPVDTVQVSCAQDRLSGLPEGIWQVEFCDATHNSNSRHLWRITRLDATHLDLATGSTTYTAPVCGGVATQKFAPEFARAAFEADRKETRGAITVFWGRWSDIQPPGGDSSRGFLSRKGPYLCAARDGFLEEFPGLDDAERKTDKSIQAGQCYRQLSD